MYFPWNYKVLKNQPVFEINTTVCTTTVYFTYRSAEESDLKLNQVVFFSPFLSKTNFVTSRFYSGERQAGVLILTPQPPKAFCEKDELIFCRAFLSYHGSSLSVGKFRWMVSLVP